MMVPIRNYLQNNQSTQAINARQARSVLTAALLKLLGRPVGPTLPSVFEVQGAKYLSASLDRVYIGKGAPDEIQDVIWLASVCGLVTPATVTGYADRNLGVDCGGFVANYWGLGHPTEANQGPNGTTGIAPRGFWEMFPSLRRRTSGAIQVDDAAVFFQDVKGEDPNTKATKKTDGTYDTTTGSQAFHIGLVAAVSAAGTNMVDLEIAESSGARASSGGDGVNVRSLGQVRATVSNNLVYCPDGNNRIYFVGRDGSARSYMPNSYGA